MRSLKLRIEELSIDTFAVGKASAGAGTVRGHESDDDGREAYATGYVTCDSTCSTCPTGLAPACCVQV